MVSYTLDGVLITAPEDMEHGEVMHYLNEERANWACSGKEISQLKIELSGKEVILSAVEKSPIRRVRRITGYLSDLTNFNPAKQDEAKSRLSHF